jgi:hypothetical protein
LANSWESQKVPQRLASGGGFFGFELMALASESDASAEGASRAG